MVEIIPDKGEAVSLPDKMNSLGMQEKDVLVVIENVNQ